MQRRRFFAARPVQQVPGQRVEVAVQVRKGSTAAAVPAPAPAPAPVPAQPVLSWISPFEGAVGDDLRGQNEPWIEVSPSDDGLVHVRERYPSVPRATTGWRGTPWRRDAQGVPYPAAGPAWRCELIECTVSISGRIPEPVCYTGFVAGVAPEHVTWRLDWDSVYDPDDDYWDAYVGDVDWGDAVSGGGQVARAVGCMVMVYPTWYGGGFDTRETLTATAIVDGKAVGALKFVAVYIGW